MNFKALTLAALAAVTTVASLPSPAHAFRMPWGPDHTNFQESSKAWYTAPHITMAEYHADLTNGNMYRFDQKYNDKYIRVEGQIMTINNGDLVFEAERIGGGRYRIYCDPGFEEYKADLANVEVGQRISVTGEYWTFDRDDIRLRWCKLGPTPSYRF